MERVIKQGMFGIIACNNIVIYSTNKDNVGENIEKHNSISWQVIKPKYYKYKDDNTIVEIWYNKKGIVLSNGLNKHLPIGYIGDSFNIQQAIEITYKQAMESLRMKQDKGYNNKDLMSRVVDELENENICYKGEDKNIKQNNNGGASDWYALPKDANTLQDLIEHRNMNGSVKDIFKACYRLGIKTEDELRDANKMAYYSLREIGRISGRKDYITIAKELMGSQADEKDENEI